MKTSSNKLFSRASRMLFALAGLLHLSPAAHAQTPCELVSTIGINTGYNYANGTKVTNSNNDPNWQVVALSPYCQGLVATTPPYAAVIPKTNNWALSDPNSNWISFLPAGLYNTTGNEPIGSMWMTVRRTFKTCQDDKLKFDLKLAADNYCSGITIDGTPVPPAAPYSQPASLAGANYTAFGIVPSFSLPISAGTHYIDVTIHNFPQSSSNPHGLNLIGQITSGSGASSLVGPTSPANCSCSSTSTECSDICYWKVQGNNILNGNNIFGTLTDDDVRIQTSSADRGIITVKGLLGWNTMNPTAYLHVNCAGNNEEDGRHSDVRFENLEKGKGYLMVIDDEGYVHNSGITPEDLAKMKTQSGDLQNEVKELKAKLNNSSAENAGFRSDAGTDNSRLLQNTPNPFSGETKIEYYVDHMNRNAFIMLCDLNGRELKRIPITATGKGAAMISGESLQSGMYIYALIIDGQTVDSKKMTLVK